MIINGYLRPLFFEHERSYGLFQLGLLYKDFKTYVIEVTESIKSHIEQCATGLGRSVVYLNSTKDKKEDIAKRIMEKDGISDGLICAIKTLEACKTAKVYGSDEGKLTVKTVNGKCLHYYLYYQRLSKILSKGIFV